MAQKCDLDKCSLTNTVTKMDKKIDTITVNQDLDQKARHVRELEDVEFKTELRDHMLNNSTQGVVRAKHIAMFLGSASLILGMVYTVTMLMQYIEGGI